jgi:hypothetical protein
MIDYRKILIAYIDMVGEAEGVDFIRESKDLTPEENAALFRAGAAGSVFDDHKTKLLKWADELEGKTSP